MREDPNNAPDPDDGPAKVLIDALSSGQVSLGDLRRRSGLGPELVGRLITKYPALFMCVEQFGQPFVKIATDPTTAILSFALSKSPFKQSGPVGGNDTAQASNAAESAPSALAEARDKLVELLKFSRYSPWLEDAGYDMGLIGQINREFPGLITISPNELGQLHVFRVSLADSVKVEPQHPPPQSRRAVHPPPEVSTMTDADRHALAWKPNSRFSASRRTRGVGNNGIGRARNPLVTI